MSRLGPGGQGCKTSSEGCWVSSALRARCLTQAPRESLFYSAVLESSLAHRGLESREHRLMLSLLYFFFSVLVGEGFETETTVLLRVVLICGMECHCVCTAVEEVLTPTVQHER